MGTCTQVQNYIITINIFKIFDEFDFLKVLERSEVRNLAVTRNKTDILIVSRLNYFAKIIFFCKP